MLNYLLISKMVYISLKSLKKNTCVVYCLTNILFYLYFIVLNTVSCYTVTIIDIVSFELNIIYHLVFNPSPANTEND